MTDSNYNEEEILSAWNEGRLSDEDVAKAGVGRPFNFSVRSIRPSRYPPISLTVEASGIEPQFSNCYIRKTRNGSSDTTELSGLQ